jgi:hypothetical protein
MKTAKKSIKQLAVVAFLMVFVCGTAFSNEIDDAIGPMEQLFNPLLKVLPNAATQQNVQPKAWIGYLVQPAPAANAGEDGNDTVPVKKELPHLTISLVNIGAGLMNSGELNKVGKAMEMGDSIIPSSVLPFPSVSFDVRIGGVKTGKVDLPFDLGFSFLMMKIPLDNVDLNWTNLGVDARYLILRQRGAVPDFSVGLGYAYWSLGMNISGEQEVSGYKGDTKINLDIHTNTVYASAQASYTLMNFFIPYLGLKLMTGEKTGKATLSITSESRNVGKNAEPFFTAQFFGGFGFDWLFFQTSIGGSIDVLNGVPGIVFTTRVSL